MKIIFLVPNPTGTIPGQRFRFERYLESLTKNGIYFKVCPFVSPAFHEILYRKGFFLKKCLFTLGGFFYRASNTFQALFFDAVYIYREAAPLGPPAFELIIRLSGKPIIFDFDDAIYLASTSDANRLARFFKFPVKTSHIIRISTLVLAGNKNLQQYALRFNRNTRVLPTVIDTENYVPGLKKAQGKVCVGWSGSITSIVLLDLLKGVLAKAYSQYACEILVIGDRNFSIPGVPLVALDWKLSSELDDLARIDIGLMPVWDNEWGRGKCGLKALQYMALEIPPVCSPVGVNSEIIDDGINGFLCKSDEEWIDKISLLIEDPGLRRKMGRAARMTVEERYSVKVNAPKFLSLLREACKKAV